MLLHTAQSLLGLTGGVSSIDLTVPDPFSAEIVARSIAGQTGVEADSWIATNDQFFLALQRAESPANMIRLFVGLSVAFGIASVLVVSVVQRSKEIGILRAMGGSRGQILRVFLLQGAVLGLLGSVARLGAGARCCWPAGASSRRNPDGTPMFPLTIEPQLFLLARAARHADRPAGGGHAGAARRAARPGGGDPWLTTCCAWKASRKAYSVGTPAETEVLHGIDLACARGEFVALMGPSGSGKSTLLNIIGLLDRPTGGKLFIDGRDTSALDEDALTRLRGHSIGFVFQYHYLSRRSPRWKT